MNDAFTNHRVDNRYGGRVSGRGGFFVASVDGFDDVLDVRAHFGAQRHVMLTAFFTLPGALLRRLDISHENPNKVSHENSPLFCRSLVGLSTGSMPKIGLVPVRIRS